jgi:hypothetical protein
MRSPDFLNEKIANSIANAIDAAFEKEMTAVIKRSYQNKSYSPISMELRAATISKILEIFQAKSIKQEQDQKDLDYRYQLPQDELYPELVEDLIRFFPAPKLPKGGTEYYSLQIIQ